MKTRLPALVSLLIAGFMLVSAMCPPDAAAQAAPKQGGTLRVALTGEPPTIDVHQTGATLVLNIAWHMVEGLFTLDKSFSVIPMLAEGVQVSGDRLTYTVKLRKGVPFHNGQEMTADDVVASLQRWGRLAATGKALFANVESVTAKDKYTVELRTKEISGVVLASLANPNQMAAIYPKALIEAGGDKPIRDVVGTGPFQLKEWAPDRHIRMTRFEKYAALPGTPNGYGGRKVAYLDEVVFVPSSEPASRVLGVEAGDFDLADWIPSDSYERLVKVPKVKTLAVKPKEWIVAPFNTTAGRLFAKRELRQAAQAAIDSEKVMQAAIGRPDFYRLSPGLLFPEQVWFSTAGKELYNQKNPGKARDLLKKAGYAGEEIRWLTTKEYEWMYRSSLAATQQLQDVGLQDQAGRRGLGHAAQEPQGVRRLRDRPGGLHRSDPGPRAELLLARLVLRGAAHGDDEGARGHDRVQGPQGALRQDPGALLRGGARPEVRRSLLPAHPPRHGPGVRQHAGALRLERVEALGAPPRG